MRIATVSEVNSYIKRKIDSDAKLQVLCVRGEISNFKHHYSGHMYMSLKDSTSSIKAVMFRQSASSLKFVPKDGMSVLAVGRISVFERDGAYQLYIDTLVPDGVGALYAAYEQLKDELKAGGYFDESHKKPIPQFPKVIGVVTASTGAAVRDIINVIKRRYPICDIKIYPTLVQGVGAGASICEAIEYFNANTDADVLIVGRGGGSIEDLWAFNEREVALCVYNSRIPVISAVGHETDYTIIDFVSDLRAPTPSAAAELATPDITKLRTFLMESKPRMVRALSSLVSSKRRQLEVCMASSVMKNPGYMIDVKAQMLDGAVKDLKNAYEKNIESRLAKLREFSYKLTALNPVATLSRGFAKVTNAGALVKSISDVKPNDEISVTVADGDINCMVMEVKHGREKENL